MTTPDPLEPAIEAAAARIRLSGAVCSDCSALEAAQEAVRAAAPIIASQARTDAAKEFARLSVDEFGRNGVIVADWLLARGEVEPTDENFSPVMVAVQQQEIADLRSRLATAERDVLEQAAEEVPPYFGRQGRLVAQWLRDRAAAKGWSDGDG